MRYHLQYWEIRIWKSCVLSHHGNSNLYGWQIMKGFRKYERWTPKEKRINIYVLGPTGSCSLSQSSVRDVHSPKTGSRATLWMTKNKILYHTRNVTKWWYWKLKIDDYRPSMYITQTKDISSGVHQANPLRFRTFRIASWAFWSWSNEEKYFFLKTHSESLCKYIKIKVPTLLTLKIKGTRQMFEAS